MALKFSSILATSWSKTSFGISLLRISGRGMKIFVWSVIVAVNLVFAFNGTLQWVQCWPVSKQWTEEMTEGRCLSPRVVQSSFTFVAGILLRWNKRWAQRNNTPP